MKLLNFIEGRLNRRDEFRQETTVNDITRKQKIAAE